MRMIALFGMLALAACSVAPGPEYRVESAAGNVSAETKARADAAVRQFVSVVQTLEPVAERECRVLTHDRNCDFEIAVDNRIGQPPNAFQTVDEAGRPVIVFNLALIVSVANSDELAFVMGHEAAHHILGHLDRTQRNATVGALVLSQIATLSGAGEAAVRSASELGATLGARRYSKAYELEADRLGTIIVAHAGFDPIKGAQFFDRLPDPGDRFLGTHPPNSARMATVRRTVVGM